MGTLRFDFTGRTVIITGAARGIGLELGRHLRTSGADVFLVDRDEDELRAAAKELDALWVAADVASSTDAERVVATALAETGRVDVLVNNAGMSPLYPSLPEVTEELYDKVVGVNLKGPFRLSSLVGTHMAEREGGSIINVSSIAAVQPTPVELPYATAKAGLNAMTLGMARAFGPAVRVNCIMPGPFLTDISKAWDLETFKKGAKVTIPLQRGGEPDEVVGAALYFASDASSYTTGAILKIDGGAAWSPG